MTERERAEKREEAREQVREERVERAAEDREQSHIERDAGSGRFVPAGTEEKFPERTVTEERRDCSRMVEQRLREPELEPLNDGIQDRDVIRELAKLQRRVELLEDFLLGPAAPDPENQARRDA